MVGRGAALSSLVVFLLFSGTVLAGSFFRVADRVRYPDGDPEKLDPFAIIHPVGYAGAGGVLEIRICVNEGDEKLVGPLQWAIDKWNRLEPTTGNCQGCVLWEEPAPAPGAFDIQTTLLHELGHCAVGLGHINLHETSGSPTATITGTCDVDGDGCCEEPTSFTSSANATAIGNGASGLRGDLEDSHVNQCPSLDLGFEQLEGTCSTGVPCPTPAQCCPNTPTPVPMQVLDFAWFRRSDNNPFMIDGTVIDKDTFSRSVAANLPIGHNYAASANRTIGEALGHPNTQAVMYSLTDPNQAYSGLTADDVNMVKMGMTGVDRDAGTPDDYTVRLGYQKSCTGADIKIRLNDSMLGGGSIGSCFAELQLSFPQGLLKVHHSLKPILGFNTLLVDLRPSTNWDYGSVIFLSGFENGDFSEWDGVVP